MSFKFRAVPVANADTSFVESIENLANSISDIENLYGRIERSNVVLENIQQAIYKIDRYADVDSKVIAIFNVDRSLESLTGKVIDQITKTEALEALDGAGSGAWEKFVSAVKQLWVKLTDFIRDMFSTVSHNVDAIRQHIDQINYDIEGMFYNGNNLKVSREVAGKLYAVLTESFNITHSYGDNKFFADKHGEHATVTSDIDDKIRDVFDHQNVLLPGGIKVATVDSEGEISFVKSFLDKEKGKLKDLGWNKAMVIELCRTYEEEQKKFNKIGAMMCSSRTKIPDPKIKQLLRAQTKTYRFMAEIYRAMYHAIGDIHKCIDMTTVAYT